MSGKCADCDVFCTFKDPPKNPGDIFGYPCDWYTIIRCKKCSNIGSSEVRAISSQSRSIPYICKECAPKIKNLFEIGTRVTLLEEQIQEVQAATKVVPDLMASLKCLGDDIKSIKQSFHTSFAELKTELTSVKLSLEQHRPHSSESSDMDTLLTEINDRAERANNIIVHNVSESNSNMIRDRIEEDKGKVMEMLVSINKEAAGADIVKVVRLGKQVDNRTRPLKVIFSNNKIAKDVLKAANISSVHAFKVKSDLTPLQRKCWTKVFEELDRRRSDGEENLTVKYRNNMPYITTNKNVKNHRKNLK